MRQAHQRARPLEENGAKILKENLSPFSEEDACSALGAGLKQSVTVTSKDETTGGNWYKLSCAEYYQFWKWTFVL
ncbi:MULTISPECIES: hypothetical protein [Aerococcus]|uniref:hypothetical protein n=1 Tax=Aerococcus urinae (strain CCUG 59500 / ACS-120-V-Col10a) TaxID=2976812 RepID=UPI00059F387F|nr:hypothetical protein [Aerococcus sp. Group 1]MCY3031064.1 hypothetical protein [Aerococcus sp. Group 1]MCY3054156.1 hypothetical protein [Aerococcus sp. Group 1]MCY3055886.1 hypothetical protein [Aerococcus sp. Group 1]MCY3061609.1 hypothetical protein [Aerococcus sp. Group 1]